MSEHVLKLIEEIRAEIAEVEKTVLPQKILANQLCARAGIAPIYLDIDNQSSTSAIKGIRRNAFYGKPLAACIRQYLEMRENFPVKEATLDEIFAALKEGGYDLTGSTEEDQKRGVSIALGKNTQTFHKLASGDFGLVSWYSNIKRKEPKSTGDIIKDYPARLQASTDENTLPPTVPKIFTTEGMPANDPILAL